MIHTKTVEGLRVFTSIESERSKIAVILQEDIAQLVAIAKLRLVGSPEVAIYLKEAVAKLSSLAFEIKPQVLENFGLHCALEELLNRRLGAGKYKVSISDETIDSIHPTLQIVVFRLTQQVFNSPYKSAICNFGLEALVVSDYLCIKMTFDIAFYSDVLQKELIADLETTMASIIYLFNGHQLTKTEIDAVTLRIFIKLI